MIRYSNQDAIAKNTKATWLRPRLVLYPILLSVTVSALITMLVYKKEFDAKIYRNLGNSFTVAEDGLIGNSLKLSLTNRTDELRSYQIQLEKPLDGRVQLIEHDAVSLKGTENHLVPILISAPFEDFSDAACPIELRITDQRRRKHASSNTFSLALPKAKIMISVVRHPQQVHPDVIAERHAKRVWVSFFLFLMLGGIECGFMLPSSRSMIQPSPSCRITTKRRCTGTNT